MRKAIEWIRDGDRDRWKTLGSQEDEQAVILGVYYLTKGGTAPMSACEI